MKQRKLKNVKDNTTFQFETRSRAAKWTVITKRKGRVTVNSQGGSSRVLDGNKMVWA